MEVVYALAADLGTDRAQLERVREDKASRRGGFVERIVLTSFAEDGWIPPRFGWCDESRSFSFQFLVERRSRSGEAMRTPAATTIAKVRRMTLKVTYCSAIPAPTTGTERPR